MYSFMSLSENLGFLGKRIKPNARTLVSSTRIFYFQILQYSLRLSNCNYSYEADFIQGLLKKNEKKQARTFNFRFRYLDDVLSLNNSRFDDLLIASIPLSLKFHRYRLACFIHWHTSRNWQWGGWKWNFTTKEMISISPLWTFHLYVATFQQHLHMEYISLRWYDIPELVVLIRIFLIEGCC